MMWEGMCRKIIFRNLVQIRSKPYELPESVVLGFYTVSFDVVLQITELFFGFQSITEIRKKS
jgi:hypothetical protein